MRDHIRSLIESRKFELDYPCLFNSSNIKCLFGILDAASSGHITSPQFKSGVRCCISQQNISLKLKRLKFFLNMLSECRKCYFRDPTDLKNFRGEHAP